MRRPREPLPPAKPDRESFQVSTTRYLTFETTKKAGLRDDGVSLAELLAKLPIKDPDRISITGIDKKYEIGGYVYNFSIEFNPTEEYIDSEFRKAMRKYERDIPKWEKKMKEYNEKFAEWKEWKKQQLEKEIGGL